MEEDTRNQNSASLTEVMVEAVQNPEQQLLLMVTDHAPMILPRDESPLASATGNSEAIRNGDNEESGTAAAMVGNVDLGQTAMDTPFTFTQEQLLSSSTYPNGDALMAGLVDVDPAFGTVTDNGHGTWTYSPVAGFTGDDVQISFTVSDGNGGVASARALLDVTASANRLPVTGNVDLGSMEEDGTLIFSAAQLLSGASDASVALTITAVTVNPHYGDVTNNGDGTWTFTPSENFHDFDVPLIFAVEDGSGGTDTAVALVDVIAVPVLPEAENVNPARVGEDHGQIFSAEQLLSNTSAVEDDLLSATSFTMNPAYENIVDNGDGTWSLTPIPLSQIDASCTNHGRSLSGPDRPGAIRQNGAKPPRHPAYPLPADIRILPSAIFRKTTHFTYTKHY